MAMSSKSKETRDRHHEVVKRHVKRAEARVVNIKPMLPPIELECVLITALVPVRNFGQIPHEGRRHFSLRNFEDINRAGYMLFLACVSYPGSRLLLCPECEDHLVLHVIA
jgi:hypothetical protein